MAIYKVGDKYFSGSGTNYTQVGTEADIQAAGGVSANIPWWAQGSVSSIPTRVETTSGGYLAPSLSYASGVSGLSEAQVRSLFQSAGFQGFTEQTPEQLSQSIYQTNSQAQNAAQQTQYKFYTQNTGGEEYLQVIPWAGNIP